MLVPRTQLAGVDLPIDRFQKYIYNRLIQEFTNIDGLKYNSYARVYRNPTLDNRIIPEAYVGNGQYSENFLDDKLDILSWFDTSEEVDYDGRFIADVSQIYCVNLKRLFTSNDRADEVIRMIVYRIVERGVDFGFKLTGFDFGVRRTYTGYDLEKIMYSNMHPFHVFKFNFNVQYNVTC